MKSKTNRKKKESSAVPSRRERRAARLGEIEDRAAPSEAGSIEQHLDMVETGRMRGDDIEHSHGAPPPDESKYQDRPGVDQMMESRYRVDMTEDGREGDEMSGDEHSAGLQGGEQELDRQPHIDTGLPGDQTYHDRENEREINPTDEENPAA